MFSRKQINFTTCLIVILSLSLSHSEILSDSIKFFRNSDDGSYSEYNTTIIYKSEDIVFDPNGMDGLYNVAESFMNAILTEDVDIKIFKDAGNGIVWEVSDITDYLSVLAGLLTVIIILLILMVFLPIGGIVFCGCRCCGNCGAKTQTSNGENNVSKIVYTVILIIIAIFLMFCMIGAFASNEQLDKGINDLPDNIEIAIMDSFLFLDDTIQEMKYLLVDNFDEFDSSLWSTINDGTNIIMDKIDTMSNITIVYQINDTATDIQESVNAVQDTISKLKISLTAFNNGFKDLKANCEPLPLCEALNTFKNIPNSDDIKTEIIDTFNDKVNLDQLMDVANEGMTTVNSTRNDISKTIDDSLHLANDSINNANDLIQENFNDVQETINKLRNSIDDQISPKINDARNYINDYYEYIHAVFVIFCCALLFIVICITLGLVFGVFCAQPSKDVKKVFTKRIGSHFLISSVIIIFIFSFFLAIATILGLSLGILSSRLICYPLRNPNNSIIINSIDSMMDLGEYGVNVTIGSLLVNCNNDESAYKAFDLQSTFDIDEINSQLKVSEFLDAIDLDDIFKDGIVLFKEDDLNSFQNLSDYDNSAYIESFEKISDNLRLVSLDEIIGLAVDPHMKNKLEECNENLKESKKLLNDLITNCKRLNTSGVEQLIENAKEANRTLNDAVINSLPNITNTFKLNVGDVIDSYKDRIVQKTKNNIGHCKPVSLVINATLASTCDGVFIPLNGLWFTMFWALLLFIPTIFIATSLASIFKAYNNGSNRHMNNSWNMSFLKRKNKKNKQTTEPNYDLYYNSTPSNRYGDMAPNFGDGAAHNRRNKNKKNKQTPEPDYDLYYNSTPSNRFGASAPKYNEGETRF